MADENDKMNRDWDFNVNLSGISAPTGKGNVQLPEGYYAVTLTDLYVNPEKNPDRVIIKMTINEGQFSGVVRTSGLGRPKSEDDKVRYFWRALAESAGYTPAALDAGSVKLGPASFKGKKAYIRYAPKQEEGTYEQIDFLAKGEWEAQKKMFVPAAAPAAGDGETPVKANSTSAAPTKGEVLKALGI